MTRLLRCKPAAHLARMMMEGKNDLLGRPGIRTLPVGCILAHGMSLSLICAASVAQPEQTVNLTTSYAFRRIQSKRLLLLVSERR